MNLRNMTLALGLCSVACNGAVCQVSKKLLQPNLGHRSAPLLMIDGLQFKDLNRNGRLDLYEDWRLPSEDRAADLVAHMSLEELAGLMVHGTLASNGPMPSLGSGTEYDLASAQKMIFDEHVSAFITRLHGPARDFAIQNNAIQKLAEQTRWGIPVLISSDPRHHFQQVIGASSKDASFSLWPEPLGLAAINDDSLTRHFGDIVRREYSAVGIRESLAPQADLATEPRWARINGTFGEDTDRARRMVQAYVAGVQNGADGLNPGSVVAVVKHWVGYGAVKDGWDSHNYYGRFAVLSDKGFALHQVPFTGAFAAHVGGIMPTYAILQEVNLDGKPMEQVGAGYNKQLLSDLLRGHYHFQGVVVGDWAITDDCDATCRNGAPVGSKPTPADIGMPWGVEDLTPAQRFAKAINAGIDQLGGTERSDTIVEDVRKGLIPESRVREAAVRILTQKFAIGLFEQPYVDAEKAASIAANPGFVQDGEDAQIRAVVLLENKRSKEGTQLLPIKPQGKKIYVYGIDPAEAEACGFTVVKDPASADVAVVRAPAPYESEHKNYFFGSRQHEGRLNFVTADPAYAELLKTSSAVPTVFVTTLERPLILTNVQSKATALLGDFGIDDKSLMKLITGVAKPMGTLPFELPSSAQSVKEQKEDMPHDSIHPLYPFGYGLKY
jgi:beta-glucosidase